jgi:acetyltransferase-like isoleucine patch superfamily enzyme
VLAQLEVDESVIAAAIVVALTGLAATHPSRWYVTGGFTSFIVTLLLVYGAPEEAERRFDERVDETLLGVGRSVSARITNGVETGAGNVIATRAVVSRRVSSSR